MLFNPWANTLLFINLSMFGVDLGGHVHPIVDHDSDSSYSNDQQWSGSQSIRDLPILRVPRANLRKYRLYAMVQCKSFFDIRVNIVIISESARLL